MMNELSLPAKLLWQAPTGWLGASLLCGFCLWFIYQQTPSIYRRSLRNTRWLVIPYVGLITGGISPRLMGLTGINWFASFEFGLALVGSVLIVLVIVRSVLAFSVSSTASAVGSRAGLVHLGHDTERERRSATSFSIAFLNIGAEEFHLAFLRSAFWEVLLTFSVVGVQTGYWAAWAALGFAIPEVLYYQATFAQRLCKCALLVTTTVLFIFTRNFWLSWLLHLLGWMLLAPAAIDDHH
jgi:hypothetical protein